MMKKVSRPLVLLLVMTLLSIVPAFAQDTKEAEAAAKAAAKAAADAEKIAAKAAEEAQKKAAKAQKEAEKREKEEQKLAEKREKEIKKNNFDIENIGNRDINEGWHPLAPDLEDEIAIGRQYSRELEQSVVILQDPVINEYVNRVGQNLVKNSDAEVPFTIKVIESDEINAVSLPGGFFYVNTGLILAADEEAELAAVMAHEIAHVAARHAAEQQGRLSMINILSIPAIFVGGIPGVIVQQAASIGVPVGLLAFGRKAEGEADKLGLQYMYKAGYDPTASVSFFEKLQARESARRKVSSIFQSHPQTEDRVAETKKNIELFLPPREQYLVTTSEFQKVRDRLARLEEMRTPTERDRAPSLRRPAPSRRNPNDDDGDGDAKTSPDDREPDPDAPPVLRRPEDR